MHEFPPGSWWARRVVQTRQAGQTLCELLLPGVGSCACSRNPSKYGSRRRNTAALHEGSKPIRELVWQLVGASAVSIGIRSHMYTSGNASHAAGTGLCNRIHAAQALGRILSGEGTGRVVEWGRGRAS